MLVREDVRKCVTFIGYQMADGSFRFAGSAFYLGRDQGSRATYLVTARHVIDGIRSKGLNYCCLRVNLKNGESKWYRASIDNWFVHPTNHSIDVAIHKGAIANEFDHLVFPYSMCITDDRMQEEEIGLGDEVFITGLFRHHYGSRRNIPIVRVGNLACLSEEKILTKSFGEIDAYLIEVRSIGGLSGSPVFLNPGTVRVIGGELKIRQGGPFFYLLGIIHGHYDVDATNIDEFESDAQETLSAERVNTGIGVVVPFHSIDEVITEYDKVHGDNYPSS